MDRMSLHHAKARFSELVDRAEQGRSTAITRHGRVVAKIVPAKAARWDRSAILDEAEALRRTIKVKRRVNLAKPIGQGRM